MAIINKLENTASVLYDGNTIASLPVTTLLLVLPTIVKTVDKLNASIGEVLTYTVTITNLGLTNITNLAFSDNLPAGCTYVTDSFKVNGTAATPTINGQAMTYTIPSIAALGVAAITFQVNVIGGEI